MIDKIIIIFLVGFHGNIIYQMKEKVIMLHHNNIWLLCTFLQPQSFTIFLISTAQIC